MRIKKWFMLGVLLCMLGLSAQPCYAQKLTEIYGEDLSVSAGKEVKIPVYIRNNDGIMGFRISVTYDTDIMEIKAVTRGDITSNGIFQDEKEETKGQLDVLWSDTQDLKEEGVIFYIIVTISDSFQTDTTMELSYSQEDTFNENWEDVVLDCGQIVVSPDQVTESSETTAVTEETGELPEVNEDTVDEFVDAAICKIPEKDLCILVEDEMKKEKIEDFSDAAAPAVKTAVSEILTQLKEKGVDTGTILDCEITVQLQTVEAVYETAQNSLEDHKNDKAETIDTKTVKKAQSVATKEETKQNSVQEDMSKLSVVILAVLVLCSQAIAKRRRY